MMKTSAEAFTRWLDAEEGGRLEFKQARANFHFDTLVKYCAAIANEGGGEIILGVTDKRPRRVVGSQAFESVERTKQGLIERLRLRFDVEEYAHPEGRVLIVHVPARPLGVPVSYEGAYWMRSGDSLAPMSADMLRRIFEETGPDFSAEICGDATVADLDATAIEDFRARWLRHSGSSALAGLAPEQLLADAELLVGGKLTYAALILFGTRHALGRYLAQAEVIFEYRSSEASLPAQQRVEYRQGFFAYYDELWRLINARNDLQSSQNRGGVFALRVDRTLRSRD
jgi:ATP-dependent DNA helicase RecG